MHPSTLQRYINHVLREFLNDFVLIYVDDVLIFTNGSLAEHDVHVRRVLQKLMDAGLQIDISKCDFGVRTTKYLGFVITAGEGIKWTLRRRGQLLNGNHLRQLEEYEGSWDSPLGVLSRIFGKS